MPDAQSVTWWIQNLKEGDESAATALGCRYFQRLAGLARQRLGDGHRRVQDEEHKRLLDALDDDTLRNIAVWKMEGWNGQEIAEKLGLTRRSVERKLERIRELWKVELEHEPGN